MESTPFGIAPPRLRHTVKTLLAATALCGALLAGRFSWAHTLRFSGLFGNLLLAWVPLVLTLVLGRIPVERSAARALVAALWLLFLPNAFYLVTDLIHTEKFGTEGLPRWFDLLLTSQFAVCGLLLGCVSLQLTQALVRSERGPRAARAVALGALALSAIGVYLGRFFRLNSWDLVTRPHKFPALAASLLEPARLRTLLTFSAIFFLCTLATWLVIGSIAQWGKEKVQG